MVLSTRVLAKVHMIMYVVFLHRKHILYVYNSLAYTRQTQQILQFCVTLAKLDSPESQHQHEMRCRRVREYSQHLQNLHLQNLRASCHCLKLIQFILSIQILFKEIFTK
jgi:hypothetical protein